MATTVAKQLAQAVIPTSATTIYTVPAASTAIVKNISVSQVMSGPTNFRVHLVSSGGTAGIGNALIYDWTLQANEPFNDLYFQPMSASGFIAVLGSNSGSTIVIGGVEIT